MGLGYSFSCYIKLYFQSLSEKKYFTDRFERIKHNYHTIYYIVHKLESNFMSYRTQSYRDNRKIKAFSYMNYPVF